MTTTSPGRSTASSSRSTTRSPTRSPSPCTRRPGCWCTPATSRWTSCRSTACSPTSAPSPGSALSRHRPAARRTPPTPRCPASSPPSAASARCSTTCSPRATQRLIVSSFASHVHRIQQVLDCAEKHRRKVALVGRSMVRNMGVARDLGLLRVAPGLMVSLDEAAADAARAGGAGRPPARRASRCRRSAGWPAASTTRSPSRPATPSSSRPRSCPATRPPSTR